MIKNYYIRKNLFFIKKLNIYYKSYYIKLKVI